MTTDTMAAAARVAAKLLASRVTSQGEVPDLIRNVYGAVARLAEPLAQPPKATLAVDRRVLAPRRVRPQTIAAAVEPEVATTPPPAPKLVRRAEVAPAAPATALAPAAAPGVRRGVVKWFAPKSGKGALRLPGLGAVGFEQRLLAESGIPRLFKGQEIEVTLAEGDGTPQLRKLTLPGVAGAAPLGSGVVRSRGAKQVVVELKREALRRAAARAEAEHVLGPNRSR